VILVEKSLKNIGMSRHVEDPVAVVAGVQDGLSGPTVLGPLHASG
jgi:hypothetical protein